MDERMDVKWMEGWLDGWNCEPVTDVIVCLGSACWYQSPRRMKKKSVLIVLQIKGAFLSKFYFLKV